jgi:hypothetical protein
MSSVTSTFFIYKYFNFCINFLVNPALSAANWKFKVLRPSVEWRREYSGIIMPLKDYRFLLRCDRLTGRQGIKRTSRYATHVFSGGWWVLEQETTLPPREAFRLTDEEAHLILDLFARWWCEAIALYQTPDVLLWLPDQLI